MSGLNSVYYWGTTENVVRAGHRAAGKDLTVEHYEHCNAITAKSGLVSP